MSSSTNCGCQDLISLLRDWWKPTSSCVAESGLFESCLRFLAPSCSSSHCPVLKALRCCARGICQMSLLDLLGESLPSGWRRWTATRWTRSSWETSAFPKRWDRALVLGNTSVSWPGDSAAPPAFRPEGGEAAGEPHTKRSGSDVTSILRDPIPYHNFSGSAGLVESGRWNRLTYFEYFE